jgi:hypothetical protein
MEDSDVLRIIVDGFGHHWSAWFEHKPYEGFGGDTPVAAVDALWKAHQAGQTATPPSDQPDIEA